MSREGDQDREIEVQGATASGIGASPVKYEMPTRGVVRIIEYISDMRGVIALTCIMWESEKNFMIQELENLKIRQPPHTQEFLTAYQKWIELEYLESIGEREHG